MNIYVFYFTYHKLGSGQIMTDENPVTTLLFQFLNIKINQAFNLYVQLKNYC